MDTPTIASVKTTEFLDCPRCEMNSLTRGTRMLPCPRGGCEVRIIGEIKTTVEVTTFDKPIRYDDDIS